MMITNIDTFVQAVTNSSGLLQNRDLLENLHPRYAELLARCSNSNPNASPSPITPLDAAIQNLLESGVTPENPVNNHSIGIITLLCAKTRTNEFNTNFENFLVQLSSFVDVADWDHLRVVANVVNEVCAAVTDQMIRRNQPILGINLIGNIATRLQAHEKMLTSVHASVLQLCCAAYNFKAALRYIIDDFEEFTSDIKQSDNSVHLLTYLYYSGLVHTALKAYDKAIYFFEACTRVPAIALSHVMLECYKKLILVSLIHTGEVAQTHKSAAQVVNRVLKPSATAYTDLATAFNISGDSLNNCIAKHIDTYRVDNNYGLVKQVRSAHMRVLIRKLTKTFLTLSLDDLGRRAGVTNTEGVNEAERVVVGMIEDGIVNAKVDQRDGMVRFLDNVAGDSRALEVIEVKIASCINLNKRIALMNERISTNPEFISKLTLDAANAGSAGLHTSELDGGASIISSSANRPGSSSSGRAGNSNIAAFNL